MSLRGSWMVKMGQEEQSQKPLVAEIATAWGTSRAYVYKLAKQGCPMHSVDEANSWRSAHAKLGVGYRSHGPKLPPLGGDALRPQSYDKTVRKVKVGTLEQSLKVAIEIEQMAAESVKNCDEAEKMTTAINVYNKAQNNRMEAEKRVLELKQTEKTLITVDEARQIIGRAWAPLLARIRSIPRRAALKANPSDDALAEEVFREEIEIAIAEGQSSYVAAV